VFPHWRKHASLKGNRNILLIVNLGWQSMNYPTTLESPLLNRHKTQPKPEYCK